MAVPTSLIEGVSIPSPAQDLKSAKRVEQYRVSAQAIYIPAGLRWNYIPVSAIENADSSRRSVTAGHCVTVTEHLPSLQLRAAGQDFTLPLEKPDSPAKILDIINKE